MKIFFLDLRDILLIHHDQVTRYGGSTGVRDFHLLESAVNAVFQEFHYGKYPEQNENVFDLAACYVFHLCKNHPFIDGNKRVAAVSMIVFLMKNNVELNCTNDELVNLILSIAKDEIKKPEISVWIKSFSLIIKDL